MNQPTAEIQLRRTARNRMARRDQRGFYGDAEDAGMQPHVDTRIDRTLPPATIREVYLQTEPGADVLTRRRVMAAGGVMRQIAITYFPDAIVDQIPQLAQHNTGPGGMYALMEQAGHGLAQADYVMPGLASPAEAVELEVESGAPVLRIVRMTRDDTTGETLEVTQLVVNEYNELRYDT